MISPEPRNITPTETLWTRSPDIENNKLNKTYKKELKDMKYKSENYILKGDNKTSNKNKYKIKDETKKEESKNIYYNNNQTNRVKSKTLDKVKIGSKSMNEIKQIARGKYINKEEESERIGNLITNTRIKALKEKDIKLKELLEKERPDKERRERELKEERERKEKIRFKRKNINFNQMNNRINNDIMNKDKKNMDNIDYSKLKTFSAKTKENSIESNLMNQKNNIKLTKNFFEDVKIKNIITLWNELEVLNTYRKYFFFIYKEIDEEEKIIFYQNEINELIELKNNIKNLTYSIELRIGLIRKISELNDELNNEVKNNKNVKVNNFIINEMIKEIEKLTEQTINIVKYMKKIKTQINMVINLGKYDINVLSQKFKFDKNYIIKMKTETSFLREGYAKVFFNFKNEESPFFIKACDKNKIKINDPLTHILPLSENTIKDIKECNYYIYKELIAYQNERPNKKIFRCISPLKKNNSAYNYFSKINFYNYKLKIEDKKKEIDKTHNNEKNDQLIINRIGIDNIITNNKEKFDKNQIQIQCNNKKSEKIPNNNSGLINSMKNSYSNNNLKNRRNKKMNTFYVNKYQNSDILELQQNFLKNNYSSLDRRESNFSVDNNNNKQIQLIKQKKKRPSFSPANVSKREEKLNFEEEDKKEE